MEANPFKFFAQAKKSESIDPNEEQREAEMRVWIEEATMHFNLQAATTETYEWLSKAIRRPHIHLQQQGNLATFTLFQSQIDRLRANPVECHINRIEALQELETGHSRRESGLQWVQLLKAKLYAEYHSLLTPAWREAVSQVLKENPRMKHRFSAELLAALGL